jgi:hypothetical protein
MGNESKVVKERTCTVDRLNNVEIKFDLDQLINDRNADSRRSGVYKLIHKGKPVIIPGADGKTPVCLELHMMDTSRQPSRGKEKVEPTFIT